MINSISKDKSHKILTVNNLLNQNLNESKAKSIAKNSISKTPSKNNLTPNQNNQQFGAESRNNLLSSSSRP